MGKRQNNNRPSKVTEPMRVLNSKFKGQLSLTERLQLRTQHHDLKAILLIGAYINFQAVMYGVTALAQSLLFPACLSASASLAFWPALIKTVNDCLRTRRQHESCFMEQDRVFRKIRSIQTQGHEGGAAAASTAAQQSLERAFALVHRQRLAYLCVLYLALLLVTISIPAKSVAPTLVFIRSKLGEGI